MCHLRSFQSGHWGIFRMYMIYIQLFHCFPVFNTGSLPMFYRVPADSKLYKPINKSGWETAKGAWAGWRMEMVAAMLEGKDFGIELLPDFPLSLMLWWEQIQKLAKSLKNMTLLWWFGVSADRVIVLLKLKLLFVLFFNPRLLILEGWGNEGCLGFYRTKDYWVIIVDDIYTGPWRRILSLPDTVEL